MPGSVWGTRIHWWTRELRLPCSCQKGWWGREEETISTVVNKMLSNIGKRHEETDTGLGWSVDAVGSVLVMKISYCGQRHWLMGSAAAPGIHCHIHAEILLQGLPPAVTQHGGETKARPAQCCGMWDSSSADGGLRIRHPSCQNFVRTAAQSKVHPTQPSFPSSLFLGVRLTLHSVMVPPALSRHAPPRHLLHVYHLLVCASWWTPVNSGEEWVGNFSLSDKACWRRR